MRLRPLVRFGSILLILTAVLAYALAPEFGRVNRAAAQTTTSYANTTQIFCGTLTTYTAPVLGVQQIGTVAVAAGIPGIITIAGMSFLIPYGTLTVGPEMFVTGTNICVKMIFGAYGQVIKLEIAPVGSTPTVPTGTTAVTPVGTTASTILLPLAASPHDSPTTIHRVGRSQWDE